MSDLNTAAAQAVESIRDLFERADGARATLTSSEERIAELAAGLRADWERIQAKGAALLSSLRDADGTETTATTQARAALASLFTELSGASDALVPALGQATGDAEVTAQTVLAMGPALAAMVAEAQETQERLRAQVDELESELENLVQAADGALDAQLETTVPQWQAAMSEGSDKLQSMIAETCTQGIQEAREVLGEKLDELKDGLEERVESLQEQAREAAESALARCFEQHTELLGELQEVAENLTELMASVSNIIDTAGTTLVNGMEIVDMGVATTSTGLELAVGVIEETVELLNRFDF